MGSHHELIVEISVYDISFHVVEVSGVLLIIVRGYRWLKVDWLVRFRRDKKSLEEGGAIGPGCGPGVEQQRERREALQYF